VGGLVGPDHLTLRAQRPGCAAHITGAESLLRQPPAVDGKRGAGDE